MSRPPRADRDTVAVVPLRAGSRRFRGKNVALLAGEELYLHTIRAAREAGLGRIVVSTDIAAILDTDLGPDVDLLRRPPSLAADSTPMSEVITHVVEYLGDATTIVLLQATSPLRQAADILACLRLYAVGRHPLVMSVAETERSVRKCGSLVRDLFVPFGEPADCFSNAQELAAVYRPNGAVYVFDTDWFSVNGFVASSYGAHVMPAERSVDIDAPEDLLRAELALERSGISS